jgi:tetratricopeptide (TPR) repeat protein
MCTMHDDLNTGLRHHQAGQLEQAAACYRKALERQPDDADALHLLGLVSYQQGRLDGAVELIGRAIALKPDAAPFHCNLAEVYRARGELERAVASCREALRLQPDYPEAANNLGMVLLAQRDTAGAAEQFQAALRLRPNDAALHNNLASALRAAGDRDGAIDRCRAALQLNPNLAEAHSNLGQMLFERYQRPKALFHCREAVRLRPDLAEAHNNLGNVLREMGQIAEAKLCYAEALRLVPRLALTYSNLGQALQEEGALVEALTCYREGLTYDPNSARIHANLASALQEQQEIDEAEAHFQRAIQLAPDYPEAHNGLGSLLHDRGRYPEAVAACRTVIRLCPDHAPGHVNLGHILEELGSFEEALACFREALRHDPENVNAHALMATMLRGKLPAADLEAARQLLARPNQPPGRRIPLLFGVAQVLDAQGDYAGAAELLREANDLSVQLWRRQGLAYNAQAHSRFVDNLCATFTPEFFKQVGTSGSDSERPIFIVGLPRSGTTLTEQILASHSRVYGAGELNHVRDLFDSLPRFLNTADPPFTCLARLDGPVLQRLARGHLDRLNELDATADRVADKMPDNYLYLGLLALLFPRAKFVHCRRELRDVAVSCWMQHFRNIRWASDQNDIARRFLDYRRLMDHWRASLPVPLLEIDYEETVADLEGTARRLVAWCGLEWEPACLAFHEKNRPVRTASLTQVRQPIYTRSVARWKNYETALAPLFAQL